MFKKRKRKRKGKINRFAAARAPNWIRVVAAGIRPTPEELAHYRKKLSGKFGAASEVRQLDPATYIPMNPRRTKDDDQKEISSSQAEVQSRRRHVT